ncbi:MAG: molybdenum transporter, periplasmic molybdate-binding protein [Herbinix sp.]|jgi:molybdate transport system substrate-binding protein|nr:molybdenum transporter, periplasmic molybdate-binding protein [Herbinix sp.]
MKKRIVFTLMILLIGSLLMSCGRKNGDNEILIGAAASLKPAMEEITGLYQKARPEVKISFTFAGSGALEQQIREGAPIDLFISAAEKQMNALEEDNLILKGSRRDLLENTIVLITPTDNQAEINSLLEITKAPVIVIGDPAYVPAGQYAMEVFEYLGIAEEVTKRAVYGKDVSEVLTWVSSGNADAGIVYATDAFGSDNVKIIAYAPEESHSTIIYPAAIIEDTKAASAAKEFLDYLQSEETKTVFIKYGFTPVK